MVDKSKKRKKGSISEADASTLLQRYSVHTVLALLQEVAQVPGENIDWQEMVKNTATGISSAREYQMLWRHLAYGQTLIDQFDHDANPMDDDSDLEYELEAFPAVGREASAEAAACVKVLIASGYPNDSHIPNNSTIEAPLTINIPNCKAAAASSDSSLLANVMQGTNICIPVSVQKQPLPSGVCGEKRPNNGASGVNLVPRRKRRAWSTEEDVKLTAAVQKYGDRNWATIAREDFGDDRKASELSQRWTQLRKKQGNSNVGTSSQLSETQLAARRAVSLALNMPMGDNLKATGQISTAAVGIKSQHQSQKASAPPPDQQLGRVVPPKPQAPTKWPPMNPTSTPDSLVKAAAVAAGARIATSADASSLIEAARSQNVVHITTGGSSMMKSSTASISNQLPSNVHFIRNGLAKAPISTFSSAKPTISRPGEAQQAQAHSTKPATAAVRPNPVENSATSIRSTELSKTTQHAVASTSNQTKEIVQSDQGANPAAERVPQDQSAALGNQSEVGKHCSPVSGNALKENSREDQASTQAKDDRGILSLSEVEDDGKKSTDNLCASKGNS
ncbi:hypothetical protein CDL12_11425 [Handroanthus impetiginosus]|uniref:Uncharacterized protein n=1 Tax=Handroanthus impetiginosus TaxID=429701 RepID=A0A2G9HEQ9_9LAMI|nr:hypothetical protein CDL12_11425 [Handroanthus impetiginosus]